MRHPFRYYEGAPQLDLPAHPAAPEIPALDVLQRQSGAFPDTAGGAQFLSSLLFHSAASSATKCIRSTGYQYSMWVNSDPHWGGDTESVRAVAHQCPRVP